MFNRAGTKPHFCQLILKYLNSKEKTDPLAAISRLQPQFSITAAERLLWQHFGLRGQLESLLSERDQNFRVTSDDGHRFVFKIGNSSEPQVTTDFQIQALLHIERQGCAVATPLVRRTLAGDVAVQIAEGGARHVCRVVSYLAGDLMSGAQSSLRQAENLGASAAQLDLALRDFRHAGEDQVLLWDVQQADKLRELQPFIAEEELRARVDRSLDDFDLRVKPQLPKLRQQIIHADLHGDNVLVNAENHDYIAGVIDFGDMLRAPLVIEVAIAASYLRATEGDAMRLIAPFVAAYNKIIPLRGAEIELLFDLIRVRLAATISILRWRAATRGADDEYSRDYLQSERSAEIFIERLEALGRSSFSQGMRRACKS